MSEFYRNLPSGELDRYFHMARLALHEAQEAVLDIQEERHRRWRVIHILHEQPDWGGGMPMEYPDNQVF